jgi:pimeloyl-ACP methyl ester carboxylesterase
VRRRLILMAALASLAASFLQPAQATAVNSVVERPVAFTVANTNTSKVPCVSDGSTYTIRGHLVGPRGAMAQRQLHAVTLYLYGYEGGEWNWDLQSVPGYNHAVEMAKLGHVSLTIDQLGYGSSGRPANGNLTCFGAQADMTHQIVQQLRSGTYRLDGGPGVKATSVVLAGHDVGGFIAEVEAYSFKDIDALIDITAADQGFQPWIVQRTATAAGEWCTESPTGYVHFVSEDEFRTLLFYDADPAVINATAALREANPCGLNRGTVPTVAISNPSGLLSFLPGGAPPPTAAGQLSQITVPVLIVFGDQDTLVWTRQGEEQQESNYTGSKDTSTEFIPKAGHFLMFDRSVPLFRDVISSWLTTRHFT